MSTPHVKSELCRMTWTEVQEAFRHNPVILLPMGSIEQHGPQTPVGDYRYMIEVSRRIAEGSGALCAPTVPWGYSEYFRHFPGCLTLQPETLKAVLLDTLDGFLRFGLDHLVFVCGHHGNMPILEQVARGVKEDYGIRMATIEPLSWLGQPFLRQLYGVPDAVTGHGSDPMTSLALHLFPDDVRMDLAQPGHLAAYQDLPLAGMSTLSLNGVPVNLYLDTEEIAPNGVLGDVRHASAEVGRLCFERMVELGTRFIAWFATLDTRAQSTALDQ